LVAVGRTAGQDGELRSTTSMLVRTQRDNLCSLMRNLQHVRIVLSIRRFILITAQCVVHGVAAYLIWRRKTTKASSLESRGIFVICVSSFPSTILRMEMETLSIGCDLKSAAEDYV